MIAQGRSRVVQVMVSTRDLQESVGFYSAVFGEEFNAEISSFQFGVWQTESFFLLTVENWREDALPSCFGMAVDDVDEVHRRAVSAGAVQVQPPMDFAWKPRSSVIDDPSGNRIQLSQA